jgi:hypothetical protein
MHSFFTIISQRARVTGDAIAKFCLTMIVYAYKLMPYLVRELSCLFVTITPTVIHDAAAKSVGSSLAHVMMMGMRMPGVSEQSVFR